MRKLHSEIGVVTKAGGFVIWMFREFNRKPFASVTQSDLNYVEDSAGGPDVTVEILPKLDKVTLVQMDARLPLDTVDDIMQLAIEGCMAVATYVLQVLAENSKQLEYRRGL